MKQYLTNKNIHIIPPAQDYTEDNSNGEIHIGDILRIFIKNYGEFLVLVSTKQKGKKFLLIDITNTAKDLSHGGIVPIGKNESSNDVEDYYLTYEQVIDHMSKKYFIHDKNRISIKIFEYATIMLT